MGLAPSIARASPYNKGLRLSACTIFHRSTTMRRLDKRTALAGAPTLVRRWIGMYHPNFGVFLGVSMRHVLSAVVQNVPGVLAHISGMLASRGYNIDSLAVGETEDPRSRG